MYRLLVALLMFGGGAYPVYAQTLITLDSFNNTDGADPSGGLIADTAGNLFGTTASSGTAGDGTVFEIVKAGSTYGAPTTLANFTNTNGYGPRAGLLADTAGNLFGTTAGDGATTFGTVFEIAKTGSTYGSVTTLANFNGTNGRLPYAGLLADAAGNLFGTTRGGGTAGGGTVFEIAKIGSAYGSPITLANFNNTNGNPYAGLIADTAGNLFGTTSGGIGYGTVFEIAKTGSTYGSPATLASFDYIDGSAPYAGLIADSAGNLFGTTAGGGTNGLGTVFEIAKTGSTYGAVTTLANFNGTNGWAPYAGLLADIAGNLFGTTAGDGATTFGTVFEIVKTDGTYGTVTTLASFNGTNGAKPLAGLYADATGNLFGTTNLGGTAGYGTVFEITNSGYVTSLSSTNVPEPASWALLGAGGLALAAIRRRTGGKKLICV